MHLGRFLGPTLYWIVGLCAVFRRWMIMRSGAAHFVFPVCFSLVQVVCYRGQKRGANRSGLDKVLEMKRTFLRFLAAAPFLFGWSMAEKSGAVASERPTVESIIEGIKRANDAFFQSRKLTLRYTADVAHRTNQPTRREWVLGRDNGGWYAEQMAVPPNEKLALPRIAILKNGLFLDWFQFNQSVNLGPKQMRNFNVLYGWDYLENAGINPYRPIVESTGMSYEDATALDEKSLPTTGPDSGLLILHQFVKEPSLPDFLQLNASKYGVAEQSESIDGEAYWAIEWPEMDKIWVDVDRGYAVRRRVYRWKPAGPLARRVDNSDLREVKPGLWLWFRQTVETYGRQKEEDWDKVIRRSTYDVSECDFSHAPGALANLRLPVGTAVTDTIRDLKYTVSDEQGDPFDKPLGEATAAAGVRRRTGIIGPIIIANVALLAVVVLYLVLRRKKAAAVVLVALCHLAAGATAEDRAVEEPAPDDVSMVDDKGEWLWKPTWLEMNACGPNSLFVLLKIAGKSVTLGQVNELVRCDPVRGCTMGDLSDAADALGVRADVRFVRPDELAAVPVPYILHGVSGLKAKTGHFVVVVGRDGVRHNLATIDPMRESFQWWPERGVLSDYSGYILVPRRHSAARSSVWLALGLTLLSTVLVWRYRTVGRRARQATAAMEKHASQPARLIST